MYLTAPLQISCHVLLAEISHHWTGPAHTGKVRVGKKQEGAEAKEKKAGKPPSEKAEAKQSKSALVAGPRWRLKHSANVERFTCTM